MFLNIGVHPKQVGEEVHPLHKFDKQSSITRKWCEIGCKLVFSHYTLFRN